MNYLKSKYYTYIPGEFMPILVDGELENKADFHRYKAQRAIWRIKNPALTYQRLTNQHS